MFRLARPVCQPEHDPSAPAAASDAGIDERIIAALRTVYDPEIPVNIYDLGLVYAIVVGASGTVDVRMTLTAPACPVAGMMPGLVESAVQKVDGVGAVNVELVWDPPWTMEHMSDEARLQLGML